MNYFLTNIHVNKLFHLNNFDIKIDDDECKHLIITGKNGSGKTVLANAMVEFFDKIRHDTTLGFWDLEKDFSQLQDNLEHVKQNNASFSDILQFEKICKRWQKRIEQTFGKVKLSFNDPRSLSKSYQHGNFIFAFYEATRKPDITEPKNPTKPDLSPSKLTKDKKVNEFLNFMVDLKIQEALARNEKKLPDADNIKSWFDGFENLLKEIFSNDKIYLKFNYQHYEFFITDNNSEFKFTQLSDGYAAIIDIVADLILKMQNIETPQREYLKHGIVVIDEIETHLHLELQRLILPFLTRVFPNVQFIVTTHSPFVLSSLPNAVVYDLEKQLRLDEDLTEYSYEAIAETFFNVPSESSYLRMRFDRFKELSSKKHLQENEQFEYDTLNAEFDQIPDGLAPQIKNEYYQIKISQNK